MSKTARNSKRIEKITIKRMVDDSPDTSWLGEFSDEAGLYAIAARGEHEGTLIDELPCEQCGKLESEHTECDDGLGDTPRGDFEFDCAIEDHCHEYDEPGIERGREYRYFNPGSVEKYKNETATWIPSDVAQKDREAYHDAQMRKQAKQDYDRMRELTNGYFCFLGIRADAEILIKSRPTDTHWTVQHITSGGLWGIESDSDADYMKDTEAEQIAELRDQLYALGFSKRAVAEAVKKATHSDGTD